MSLLVAGYDEKAGPTLFQIDPSGSFWAWKATAIGKNYVNAKTFLEKRYNDDISLEDAMCVCSLLFPTLLTFDRTATLHC